jgi:hypothetical protein
VSWSAPTTANINFFIFIDLLGKPPEGNKPLGKPRLRWEYNIITDLKSNRMGCYGLDYFG